MNNGYNFDPDSHYGYEYNYQKKIKSLNEINRHGFTIGVCLVVYIAVSYIMSLLISYTSLNAVFQSNETLYESVNLIFTVLGVFIPFFIASSSVKKYYKTESFGFDRPFDMRLFATAVPAGLMLCFFGDKISGWIVSFFSIFGVTMNSVEADVPLSSGALLITFLSSVVAAPLAEEFAIRGITMQPLKKYGDKFALIMAALVFALMHRNIVQGMFAFVAGIVLGYFSIATGSVWTGVFIHFFNNLASFIMTLCKQRLSSDAFFDIYIAMEIIVYVVGIICLISFARNKNRIKLQKCSVPMITTGEKTKNFLIPIPMLAAIAVMAVGTASYISFGG